jgi:predicted DNA-binding protein (UPF0251 family)
MKFYEPLRMLGKGHRPSTHPDAHGMERQPLRFCKPRGRNVLLTEQKVKDIRANPLNLSYKELGKRFGVSKSTIQNIMSRITWKHI